MTGSSAPPLLLLAQRVDVRLGSLLSFLQRGRAAKRSAPGRRPHAHPVLSDGFQRDQALVEQHRDRVGQHLLEEFAVLRAKVGERVVVY